VISFAPSLRIVVKLEFLRRIGAFYWSQVVLVNIFERIEDFYRWLGIYADVRMNRITKESESNE